MKPDKKSRSDPFVIRPWLLILSSFIVLSAIWAGWVRWSALHSQPPSQPGSAMSAQYEAVIAPAKSPVQSIGEAAPPVSSTGSVVVAAPPLPQPSAYARRLLSAITRLDRANISLTAEDAEQWLRNLEGLIQQGPDGAAAIAEFLQRNTDVRLGRAGKELLGVDSVREALFDALVRIGGPEAISATLQAMQNSADPREIALLAQNLETLAPGMHRSDSIAAAREVLTMAGDGKLVGSDVAPLFEVLQNYGGSDAVADLEQATRRWEYYPAIALANLPDGGGIPSLVQMAQENGSAKTMALQLLAQLSGKHDAARAALLSQAQAGGIPPHAWPFLVNCLAGNEYHFLNSGFANPQGRPRGGNVSIAYVSSGNQTFYSAFNPAALTPEEIDARIAFINHLRPVVNSQPAGLEAIQRAEQLLMERLPNIAVSR